jgi:hypothetical protein
MGVQQFKKSSTSYVHICVPFFICNGAGANDESGERKGLVYIDNLPAKMKGKILHFPSLGKVSTHKT